MLPKRTQPIYNPATLSPGTNVLLGTTVPVEIDNAFPIEEILVFVNITAGATGPTLTGPDNLLNILKKAELSINTGDNKPRTIVSASGVGLLEYVQHVDSLDADTLSVVGLAQPGGVIANNLKMRLCYRIPLVHPALAEPLRTRCLLPVQLYTSKPVLNLTFEQSANIYSAGSIATVTCEVVLIRREITVQLTTQIIADGGFIDFDLIEKANAIAVGVSGEVRFPIPLPGSYLGMLFRQYLGGASVTRAELDQVTTFGAETPWRLESGGVAPHAWRWKHLRTIGGFRADQNNITQTSSPIIAGAVVGGTSFCPSASTYLDFLGDGVPSEGIAELGSVLDCNIPKNSGLVMEVIGNVAAVATNASTMFTMGHRLYGDLSKWQTLKVK
jgi:hypothetical protein